MNYNGLEIEYLGHSGFLIKSAGKMIYIDPFKINSESQADVIFITHDHYDHCSLEDLEKIAKDGTIIVIPSDCQSKINHLKQDVNVQITSPGKSLVIQGIKVRTVPAYNLGKLFHRKDDEWNGYIIDINGIKIYHAGDTDLIPEMSNFGEIDIAMLPVSGKFTMTAEEAAKAASIIKPKIAIPMHYGSIFGVRQDAQKFVSLCIEKGIKAELLEKKQNGILNRH